MKLNIIILLVIFMISITPCGASVIYTFEGEVTRKHDLGYEIFSEDIGDYVSFRFMVDYSRQGQYTWDGFEYIFEDSSQIDSSYAKFISGNTVDHNYLHYAQGSPNFTYNTLVDRFLVDEASIYLGDWFNINATESIHNWNIGQFATFQSIGAVSSDIIDYPFIAGDLYLTNISTPIPAPESNSLLLIGLVAFFYLRKIVIKKEVSYYSS